MWEQTLSGLIKALRSNKDDEKRVIQQALSEISQEAKSTDLDLKAAAILKMCYLDMLGYPQLSSYSFNVVECMSSSRFHIKQIGYLAASQSFGPNTEVSMLTTNLVKKDLVSHANHPMSFLSLTNGNLTSTTSVLSLTLSSLPHLLDSQNSADLAPDLISMLNHSKPNIRRRAVTVSYTLACADMIRMMEEQDGLFENSDMSAFDPKSCKSMDIWVERYREKLQDDDPGVVSSTVSVICELAMKCPWPWLELAAELYDLLKLKNNNWMMIKIVKIFTALTPIEPRLTKKLLPALSELISSTKAMSLLYECIHTILASGMLIHTTSMEDSHNLAKICIEKLANFLDHVDQNLRYMALVGLNKLLPSHPQFLEGYLATIVELVHGTDPMLTSQALDLLEGIQYLPHTLKNTIDHLIDTLEGSKKSLTSEAIGPSDAVRALMAINLSSKPCLPSLSLASNHNLRMINVIITICCKSAYSHIPDFNWFLEILVRLIRLLASFSPWDIYRDPSTVADNRDSDTVTRLADALMDVSSRVTNIRPQAVKKMLSLLHDDTFLANVSSDCGSGAEVEGLKSDSFEIENERCTPVSSLITTAIWICGEYSTSEHVDLKDVISTLFKRQLILDNCSKLPQISTFALHNGLKVFVKWLREAVDQWYSDVPSTESYAQDSFREMQSAESQETHSQQSQQDAKLAQLNKLISAIRDRARELSKQRDTWASSHLFTTIDHLQLLDRANEVNVIMDLITKELVGFRPFHDLPTYDHQTHSNRYQDPLYGLSEIGEDNPFATSPDRGFQRQTSDLNFSSDYRLAFSKQDKIQPPYWYKLLSDLFFIYELKPVAHSAQGMILAPDELDLDSWIPHLKETAGRLDSPSGFDEFGRAIGANFDNPYQSTSNEPFFDDPYTDKSVSQKRAKKKKKVVDEQALAKAKMDRIEKQRADPFYINTTSTSTKKKKKDKSIPGTQASEPQTSADLLNIDSIPIVKLSLSVSDLGSPIAGASVVSQDTRPRPWLEKSAASSSLGSSSPRPAVDVEGEVPDLSYLKKHNTQNGDKSSSMSTNKSTSKTSPATKAESSNTLALAVQSDYHEALVPHTPDSIKVVKKKLSSKKKKNKLNN